MKAETIVILGLGRLGASIGLAVKKKLSMNVIGHDPDLNTARIAHEKVGGVDSVENNLFKAVSKADILVMTTPVSELQETLKIIGNGVQSHTLILDLSQLKGPGLKWARQSVRSGHYVGAMPILAADWLHDGREETHVATADLFQNSLLCLMPAPDADPQAVETAVNFGRIIGAQPYFIDPDEYDNLIQGTETLPGLMAVALMKALQRSTSWNDILKFAGQSLALATLPLAHPEDLSLMAVNDKEATLRWLEAIVKELNDLRRVIYESETQVVTAVIEAPSIEREKWLHKRRENNWDERASLNAEQPTMFGQMFGGLAAGSKRRGRKINKLSQSEISQPEAGPFAGKPHFARDPQLPMGIDGAATRPLRILMIAPTSFFSDYGGHIRILEETRTLQAMGHKVAIVTYYKGSDMPGLDIRRTRPLPWRTDYEVGSSRHKLAFDIYLAAQSIIEGLRYRPDIVHGHMHEGAFIGAIVAKLLHVPLVFDFQGSLTAEMVDHHFLNENGRVYTWAFRLEKWINQLPAAILTSSRQATELLQHQFGVPTTCLHPLPDCADTTRFNPDSFSLEGKQFLKAQLGIPPDRLIVAYLGLLTDYQGIPHLIEAASRLKQMDESAHFLIMGYPNVDHYKQLAHVKGVADRITFTGKVEYRDAPAYLSLGDIAVAPKMSATEGSGKLLNYMALSQPIVAYDSPVHREYLADLGVYAPLGDVAAFSRAIAALLLDASRRQDLGQRLRQRAISEYSWQHAGEKIVNLYRCLTN